ncbi:DUF58 domain-containing protein [Bacillus sp. SCS-151]|uniref:DUF58 domain-containing protein n=1 Tax=Nanhaiella sioensis TaxID=3115293 RepID=UPI00397E8041
MNWYKTVHIPTIFSRSIWLVSLLLFIEFIFIKSNILFFCIFVLCSLYFFIYLYLNNIGKYIRIEDEKTTIRMFPNDEATMYLKLHHKGILPLLQGNVTFTCNNIIKCTNIPKLYDNVMAKRAPYKLPLTYQYKSSKSYPVNIVANKRGVTRIREINLRIFDPFHIGTVSHYNTWGIGQEILVYPEPKPLANIQTFSKMRAGEQIYPHSLFEDISRIRGAREYAANDPFSRIHWNLSAKNGQLMTKEYDKTVYHKWTIILNVLKDRQMSFDLSEEMEDYISYVAFICQYAYKQNIPFEIYANVVTNSNDSIFHLEPGTGGKHLSIALEMLARINEGNYIKHINHFFHSLDRRIDEDAIVLYFGDYGSTIANYLASWSRGGMSLFNVENNEEYGYLQPFKLRSDALA